MPHDLRIIEQIFVSYGGSRNHNSIIFLDILITKNHLNENCSGHSCFVSSDAKSGSARTRLTVWFRKDCAEDVMMRKFRDALLCISLNG